MNHIIHCVKKMQRINSFIYVINVILYMFPYIACLFCNCGEISSDFHFSCTTFWHFDFYSENALFL